MADKYYVGPNLLGDIRRVITRVDSTPIGKVAGNEQYVNDESIKQPPTFRIGTASGSWSKGATQSVTITVAGNTSTTSATNLFADITVSTASTSSYSCAIARQGTAWYLIAAECQ